MHKYSNYYKGEVYEGSEPYAFVSYSHKDSTVVLPIAGELNSRGLRIWFDDGIEAGSEWPEYLAEHLANASVVLAFISKNFNDSKYCRREIHFATKLNKPIICIYIDDAKLSYGMEMELSSMQGFMKANYASDELLVQNMMSVQIIKDLIKTDDVKAVKETASIPSSNKAPIVAAKPVVKSSKRPVGNTAKKNRSTYLIILIITGFIVLGSLALLVGSIIKYKKNNDDAKKMLVSLLPSPGTEYAGDITEEMLIGQYSNFYLDATNTDNALTAVVSQYPDMRYVERITNPQNGTAGRVSSSSVPYRIECQRLIDCSGVKTPAGLFLSDYDLDLESEWQRLYNDLYELEPETADLYYESYVYMYNSFFVSMDFYTEDGVAASGKYQYIYTITDNRMNCSRFNIGDNNEIVLYDADETYTVSFYDNALIISADDGSEIELYSNELNKFIQGSNTVYSIDGYAYDVDNVYDDIVMFDITLLMNNDRSLWETVTLHFTDGGYTTDAMLDPHTYGNFTITWNSVRHSDSGTTDYEPGEISIRVIGSGSPFSALFIVDEEGNYYNYSADTIDSYQESAST